MEPNQPPAFFVRGPSPLARLAFFAAVSITLMAVDARLHYLTEIRQGFMTVLQPLEVIVTTPVVAYQRVRDYFVTQDSLAEANRRIHLQLLQQNADLQRFHTLQQENAHLRDLLGAAQVSVHATKLGEIVHADRDLFTHKVVVNVGARHGVTAGRAVIDEYGVVGQVTRVYPFSSEVTLATDKDLAIPVQVERTGMRAIAFGHGRGNVVDLPYLPVSTDIQQGDILVTSGFDGVYPAGLAVAKVNLVERRADSPFAHIVCTPVAGISSHRQVLIVEVSTAPPSGINIKQPPAPAATSHHAPSKP
jgi:rod shape-determining protein MreC